MKKSLVFLLSTWSLLLLSACGGSGARHVVTPSITTTEAQVMAAPATVGTNYNFVFQATSGTAGGPFTWQAMGLPASGLSLDPTSGTVSGTPTSKVSVAFSLTVTDSLGHSSPAVQFAITVNNPSPPAITTTQAQVTAAPAMIENSYSFTFAAGGGLAPLTWSESGALPSNMTFATGGVLSGTATATGSFPITVMVQDALSQKATPQNFTIAVINPPPPTISTTPPPDSGVVNRPYNFTFTATAGFPPLAWTESGALPAGLTLSTAGVLSGTPTVVGTSPITVMVQDSHGRSGAPQNFAIQVSLGFNSTGSMGSPRQSHTATLLKTGKVLVAGGESDLDATTTLGTAELYDSESGMFSPTGSMTSPRTKHVATLLLDGRVFVVGGLDANGNALATAEIYDPGTAKFSSTSDMKGPRVEHTATLLDDGKVLVVGGLDANGNALLTAEIYDPGTGKFSPIIALQDARARHTATLLNTGNVLVAGGDNSTGELITAELFDPSSQSFTLTTNDMTVQRARHTATLLNDGKVLLAGPDLTAEIFDPSIGTFTVTGSLPSTSGRSGTTATLRPDGTVLVAGGQYSVFSCGLGSGIFTQSVAEADLFNPGTGSFSQTSNMSELRSQHTATLLANGRVLVTGGIAWSLFHFPGTPLCKQKVPVSAGAELFP
jgi:hypothetical protein